MCAFDFTQAVPSVFIELHNSSLSSLYPVKKTFIFVLVLQGHMNKDHADETKLIVQHSTNVKASK
jgi:hypothetical protein